MEGSRGIADKAALGSAILDTKSELIVTAALALAINRRT